MRLRLTTISGEHINSPEIVPDNPRHDMKHSSIKSKLHKIGRQIEKRQKDIIYYSILERK